MVTIFRFQKYDIGSESIRISKRWGTREAIRALGGEVLAETATEAPDECVQSDVIGLTPIGYEPTSINGAQEQVEAGETFMNRYEDLFRTLAK
jgi:hypothetical protein